MVSLVAIESHLTDTLTDVRMQMLRPIVASESGAERNGVSMSINWLLSRSGGLRGFDPNQSIGDRIINSRADGGDAN